MAFKLFRGPLRSPLFVLMSALLLMAQIAASSTQAAMAPTGETGSQLPPVRIVDGRLLAGEQPFVVRGVNYMHPSGTEPGCPELHFGADARCPWRPEAVEADMARLRALGVNTVRVFLNYYVFGGARAASPAYDMAPALAHLDGLIASANRQGIYVLPVLLAKFPQEQLTADGYERAAELHVRPLVAHLAGHPGVMGLDLFNEPDIGSPIEGHCWDWDNGDHPLCIELAKGRLEFLGRLGAEARAIDPGRPLTIGAAFAKSYFRPYAAPARLDDLVDFYSFHYYDNDPFDSGRYAQHWYYGQGFPRDLERSLAELEALAGAKPVVITELGFPTGEGALRDEQALRADLRTALATAEAAGAGLLLWPFQEPHEALLGDLFLAPAE
jgi:endo-1,4-beta-mannosidase